jgi:hypothetical protein
LRAKHAHEFSKVSPNYLGVGLVLQDKNTVNQIEVIRGEVLEIGPLVQMEVAGGIEFCGQFEHLA